MINLNMDSGEKFNTLKKCGIIDDVSYNQYKYKFFIKIDDVNYFFKELSHNSIINELVMVRIFKLFDVSVVSQNYACLSDGKYGIISKDFREQTYNYVTISEILDEYYSFLVDNSRNIGLSNAFLNNLETIWEALEYRYKKYPNYEDKIKKIMDELVKLFMIDMIVGQEDRHELNITIKENDHDFSLSNIYDNELAFSYDSFALGVSPDSWKSRGIDFNVSLFDEFFDTSSIEYLEKFKFLLDTLDVSMFSDIVNDIRNNDEIDKNNPYYDKLISIYSDKYNEFYNRLKKRSK